MPTHQFEDYFWYSGPFGWDSGRLIQICRTCNLLREVKATSEDAARIGHCPPGIFVIAGICIGAYGPYKAGPECPGRAACEPQLGLR